MVFTWSMDTVKAVQWLSVFSDTICGRFSRWAKSTDIGVQIRPLAWVAMKFTFSVVACSAAQIRSPSFSRSGSSVQRISFPALSASSASSTVLYLKLIAIVLPCFFCLLYFTGESPAFLYSKIRFPPGIPRSLCFAGLLPVPDSSAAAVRIFR